MIRRGKRGGIRHAVGFMRMKPAETFLEPLETREQKLCKRKLLQEQTFNTPASGSSGNVQLAARTTDSLK